MVRDISNIQGFDWDTGNLDKNLKKHRVSNQESEEVFNNNPFISEDNQHSEHEERFKSLGKTNQGRLLFVSFTVRKIEQIFKIRVISARDVNEKEKIEYEKIKTSARV